MPRSSEVPRGSLYQTSDPRRALDNLLVRDALFTKEVAKAASDLNLHVVEVDGHGGNRRHDSTCWGNSRIAGGLKLYDGGLRGRRTRWGIGRQTAKGRHRLAGYAVLSADSIADYDPLSPELRRAG